VAFREASLTAVARLGKKLLTNQVPSAWKVKYSNQSRGILRWRRITAPDSAASARYEDDLVFEVIGHSYFTTKSISNKLEYVKVLEVDIAAVM